jgi:hypothetical protein
MGNEGMDQGTWVLYSWVPKVISDEGFPIQNQSFAALISQQQPERIT